MMLKLVAWAFSSLVDWALGLVLIVCVIGGAGLWGEMMIGADEFWNFGIVLGFLVGLIIDVIFGGVIAVFLEMRADIKRMTTIMAGLYQHITGETFEDDIDEDPLSSVLDDMDEDSPLSSVLVDVGSKPAVVHSSAGNDDTFEVAVDVFCTTCGKKVDTSSSEVRIYKTCNHCHGNL